MTSECAHYLRDTHKKEGGRSSLYKEEEEYKESERSKHVSCQSINQSTSVHSLATSQRYKEWESTIAILLCLYRNNVDESI